jgi:hypothetical protein
MLLCIDFFSYTTEQYILVFKEDRAKLDWQDGVGTTFELAFTVHTHIQANKKTWTINRILVFILRQLMI